MHADKQSEFHQDGCRRRRTLFCTGACAARMVNNSEYNSSNLRSRCTTCSGRRARDCCVILAAQSHKSSEHATERGANHAGVGDHKECGPSEGGPHTSSGQIPTTGNTQERARNSCGHHGHELRLDRSKTTNTRSKAAPALCVGWSAWLHNTKSHEDSNKSMNGTNKLSTERTPPKWKWGCHTLASPARTMGRPMVEWTRLATSTNSCQNWTRSTSPIPAWGA